MMKTQTLRFLSATALAVAMCTVVTAQEFSATAEEVAEWRAAATKGEAWAQHNLGVAYFFGGGVDEDKREAVRWYRKAADQGSATSQYSVGNAYWFGVGAIEDKREAVRWFRKAAEQGFAPAQTNLGNAYFNGVGVIEDKREAVRWFRKAAEQGIVAAQNNLGYAYNAGEGVAQDSREAYIWWSIAKASGDEIAIDNFDTTDWRSLLTASAIRSAKKEAARRLEKIDIQSAEFKEEYSDLGKTAARKPKGVNAAAQVFENAWRSVVVVLNGDSQGSGVIVRPNIVATNCHVVDSGGNIFVYKAAERRADTTAKFLATIRHADRNKDFCLLDVRNLWGVVATVRKYNTLIIGENVYGLGAPQGFDLSLSAGVISQLRENNGARLIQTDTAISPGSSGGGLFDSESNLIGITTSKITDESTEGIGFAIPADLVLGN